VATELRPPGDEACPGRFERLGGVKEGGGGGVSSLASLPFSLRSGLIVTASPFIGVIS
jgi:hypothetical protein